MKNTKSKEQRKEEFGTELREELTERVSSLRDSITSAGHLTEAEANSIVREALTGVLEDEKATEVYESQSVYIREHFGKRISKVANYGWGVSDDSICTKVYGHGYLSSYWTAEGVEHSFEPFEKTEVKA